MSLLGVFGDCIVQAAEADHTATITKFFGKAQILSNPSDKKQGPPPHVLFEGTYYNVEPARMGSKVKIGSVFQTQEKTMVRLVYPNGDQIMISPSSSYRVSMEKKADDDKPISDLIYGKFRAVISKEGPRNTMEVRTRTMVMGIRGTDFHVVALDESGGSVVSVLRGAVAVAARAATPNELVKPIEVKSGFSAKIPVAAPPASDQVGTTSAASPIQVAATDKLDLRAIQESVSFKKGQVEEPKVEPEIQKELALLEQKAVESTKQDIKGSDPDLYKRIEAAEAGGKKIDNIEVLQAVTIEKAIVRAPEPSLEKLEKLEKEGAIKKGEKPVRKPSSQELDDMEGSIYDKYFKR